MSTSNPNQPPEKQASPLPPRPIAPPPPGSHLGVSPIKISDPKTKPGGKPAQLSKLKPTQTKSDRQDTFAITMAPPSKATKLKPTPKQLKPFLFLIPIFFLFISLSLAYVGYMQIRSAFSTSPASPNAASGETIELTYWGMWESPSAMETIIEEYELQHPNINITYKQQSPTDYRERLQSALNSGSGPDLYRFHNTWAPMLKNQLEPVPDSIMTQPQIEATFYPVIKDTLLSANGYLGLPLQIDGLALYYNRHLFTINGQVPPTSWEELQVIAQKLTIPNADGGLQRAGVALGTTTNVDHWSDILALLLLGNGVSLPRPSQFTTQDEQVICQACDATTFYTNFVTKAKVWDESMPNSTQAFATEKVAMMFGPSWRANQIRQINPSLNFATVPVPQLPGSKIGWATYWVEGVSSQSSTAKKQASWQFLNHLIQKDTLRRFYTLSTQSGKMLGEPFSRQDMADQLIGDPYAGAFVSQGNYYSSWFMAGNTGDNGLNDAVIASFTPIIDGLLKSQETPTVTLPIAQTQIQQILVQYGLPH